MQSRSQSNASATGVIKASDLKSLTADINSNNPNAVIISTNEFKRIKEAAQQLSKSEQMNLNKTANEEKLQKFAAAQARKDKMLLLEETRKRNIKKSDIEIEQEAKNKIMNLRADQMKLNDHDDVKHMNQMMSYSKCVTVRDKQLSEKQNRLDEEQAEEERLDLMMEIERLKKFKN